LGFHKLCCGLVGRCHGTWDDRCTGFKQRRCNRLISSGADPVSMDAIDVSCGQYMAVASEFFIRPDTLFDQAPDLALSFTMLVTAWWSFPYVMVMATAAMQSIPSELYEAVEIDGGGAVIKFRYVTLPQILPSLGSTALPLSIMYLTLITLLIVMTGGGPLGATTTLSLEAFRGTIQAVNIGPTAVVSIVVLLINVLVGAVYTRLTGRVTG
jgi:ABC-type sugar transport system permease subunit